MIEIDFYKTRLKQDCNNPLGEDYKLANEILIFLIYNSIFAQNISFGGDMMSVFNNKYDHELHYLRLDFYKYICDENSINEFVKALNKNNYGIKIKLSAKIIKKYTNPITFLALFDIFDSKKHCISSIRVAFGKLEKNQIIQKSWYSLKELETMVYISINNVEIEASYELELLKNELIFIPDTFNIKRIIYMFNKLNSKTKASVINKVFAFKNDEEKVSFLSSIFTNVLYKNNKFSKDCFAVLIKS